MEFVIIEPWVKISSMSSFSMKFFHAEFSTALLQYRASMVLVFHIGLPTTIFALRSGHVFVFWLPLFYWFDSRLE